MSGKTIVIARAFEDSDELSQAVKAKGFTPLVEPVLTIEYLKPDLPEIEAETPLIFTSANGVRAFAQKSALRENPVYTVGRNTADEARQAGFTNIETAAGTVEDLAETLTKALRTSLISALYIRGEDISQDLRQILSKNGISAAQWTGYRAIPATNLSINLLKALDGREIEAVMFFSSRGGRVFAELIEQYDRLTRMRTIKALCISEAVVKSVSVLPFQQMLIAEKQDRYGMMKLLQNLRN